MAGIGWNPGLVQELSKTKPGKTIPTKEGVLFSGYNAFSREFKKGGLSRFKQISEWLGSDFEGPIIFDESHNLQNAKDIKEGRYTKKASEMALAAMELQKQLPLARVVYVSATGATEVSNLAYAERLGLWGEGTPFPTVADFITSIEAGGIAAMECVAQNLKAQGSYMARSLSFDQGLPEPVSYDRLEHKLTKAQVEIYNRWSEAWQVVLQNINKALEFTAGQTRPDGTVKVDPKAKGSALSQFWGAHQRSFNQLLTALTMPSVIEDMRKQLEGGKALVLQIVNTNEADQKRALEKLESEEDFDRLDLSPGDQLINFIEHSFPTQKYEPVEDENGNIRMEPMVDSKGDPVPVPNAVRLKEKLISDLQQIRKILPEGALDQVLNTFGPSQVAEVTGRSRRVVRTKDDEGLKTVVEPWSRTKSDADADLFNAGKKPILIFSEAGGTGRSYHADRSIENQDKRIHYLIQAGWSAAKAVQGLGRTHRSNEAHSPHYVLVTTDLPGHRRFISTIARRLAQLGALTKGQRQTGSTGLFSAQDDLETKIAHDTVNAMLNMIAEGRGQYTENNITYPIPVRDFESMTGLRLLKDDGGMREEQVPISKFLNRLLSLNPAWQNRIFGMFSSMLSSRIEAASKAGLLDRGMETLKAEKIALEDKEAIYTDEKTGATADLVRLKVTRKVDKWSWGDVSDMEKWYLNKRSGKVWAVRYRRVVTYDTGEVGEHVILQGVTTRETVEDYLLQDEDHYQPLSEAAAKKEWEAQFKAIPATRDETTYLVSGLLLPIWKRLPSSQPRIMRVVTDKGKQFIGRLIPQKELNHTLRVLGAKGAFLKIGPQEALDRVLTNDQRLELSNGWTLHRAFYSGENRVELTGDRLEPYKTQFEKHGIQNEIANWKDRYFVPNAEALAWVLEQGQILQPDGPATEDPIPATDDIPDQEPEQTTFEETGASSLGKKAEFFLGRDDGKWLAAPEAQALEVEGAPKDLDLFIIPPVAGRGGWKVYEGMTGRLFAQGWNRDVATREAKAYLGDAGIEKIREVIAATIQKVGLSPRYQEGGAMAPKELQAGLSFKEAFKGIRAAFSWLKDNRVIPPDELQSKDISRFEEIAQIPSDMAEDHAEIRPLLQANRRGERLSHRISHELATHIEPYLLLGPKDQKQVDQALLKEEGRKEASSLSRFRAIHRLPQALAEAAMGVRTALDRCKDLIVDVFIGDFRQDQLDRIKQGLPAIPAERFDSFVQELRALPDTADTYQVLTVAEQYLPEMLPRSITRMRSEGDAKSLAGTLRTKGEIAFAHMAGGKRRWAVSVVTNSLAKNILYFREQLLAWDRTVNNYIPHRRHGKYEIAAYDEEGRTLWFSAHETFQDFKKAEQHVRAKFPQANIKIGPHMQPFYENLQDVTPVKLAAIIEGAHLNEQTKTLLKREFYDLIRSKGFGSTFIHRRETLGIPGYDVNLRQGVSDYMAGLSGWLGKVEKIKGFSKAMEGIKRDAKPRVFKWASEWSNYVLANSREYEAIRNLLFHWNIGGVLKSALVNSTQNLSTGIAVLGDYTNAPTVRLIKAMDKATSYMLSTEGRGKLSAEEEAAVNWAMETGELSAMLFQEQSAVKQNPLYRSSPVKGVLEEEGLRRKTLAGWQSAKVYGGRASGALFDIAERFNRLTMFLAAYQAAKQKGLREDLAREKALALVREAHFEYGKANRPVMARHEGSLFFVFRTWTLNYLNLYKKHLKQVGRGDWERGSKGLLRLLAPALLLGGITAIPGVGAGLRWWWRREYGKDPEDELRASGPYGWILSRFLFRGLPAVAGFDFSGSLDPQIPTEAADLPGAILGPFEKIPRAARDLRARNYLRAAEDIAPEVIRSPLAALRMKTQGATTRGGQPIPDETGRKQLKLTTREALQKAVGVQPTRLSEQFETSEAIRDAADRRRAILQRLADRYALSDTPKERSGIIRELREYDQDMKARNRPAEIITAKEFFAAVRARKRPYTPSGAKRAEMYRRSVESNNP